MKKYFVRKGKGLTNLILIIIIVISSTGLMFLMLQKYTNANYDDISANEDGMIKPQGIVDDLYTTQWLDNPTFESPIDPWYNTSTGDSSDINATTSLNQANYEVQGISRSIQIDNTLSSSDWTPYRNPEKPVYPDVYVINSSGCSVYHYWDEQVNQTRNTPSVHWKRNVNMPVNMSDYIITSANLEVTFNASAEVSPHAISGRGVDRQGDSGLDAYAIGDYAEFYVLISDIDGTQEYQIAYNQTVNLGRDSPATPTIADTIMNTVPEQVLIGLLTAVLATDDYNFTITLGIDIYCEDNEFGADDDQFNLLLFKAFNLTFSYEKKIDQFTGLSWNQVGDQISGSDIDIINATLNFKFKTDQTWPLLDSPNSEIRVYINNRLHTEAVKLSEANSTFQDIKQGGFDVTDLILKNVNISISIEVYIADTFALDQKITISITNASLLISYVESTVEDITSLDLFLNSVNKSLEKAIEVKWGTTVNVTAIYKDSLNNFIPDAVVQLNPVLDPVNLTENPSLQLYQISIDTKDLDLGNNYILLSANKRYYEDILILFNIKVLERDTELQLFLNGENKTLDKSIQMIYGNDGNITVTYQDIEDLPHIHNDEALVQLEGLGSPKNLTESPSYHQYSIIINTADLGLGNSFLTVIAQKENYTTQSIRFKIEVLERNSYIDTILLNGIELASIELQWGENLNIAVTYNDTANGSFISGALVQIAGTTILENFTENPLSYSIDIHTSLLELGVNFLTISAIKENYTLASSIITVNVKERDTYIDEILLNHIDHTQNKTLTLTSGELLNVTFKYKDDLSGNPLGGASAIIVGGPYSDNMTENLLTNQYSIEFNTSILGVGASFLYIIASLENYSISSEVLTIYIGERGSVLGIKLNGTQYPDNYITVEVWQQINITVTYADLITLNHLSLATIELVGFGNFTEDLANQQYTFIVNASDLDQGVDILNIIARKEGYESQPAQITVEITERKTTMSLFLNNINMTADPYLDIPIGSQINISISYYDSSSLFVSDASVQLLGEGLSENLTENGMNERYSYILDTRQLDIGVRILTVAAFKNNFQLQTIDIRIDVRRIRTNITGESVKEVNPNEPFDISVILLDLDFNQTILNASVTYRWAGGEGELIDPDQDGEYEGTISGVPLGNTFTITITAYKGDDYSFERYEILVTAIQAPEESLLFLILLIIAGSVATVLGIYLYVYQKYLKYPKPVRKVRKYNKTLKRKTDPRVDITEREVALKKSYQSELEKSSKLMKGTPTQEQGVQSLKPPKK